MSRHDGPGFSHGSSTLVSFLFCLGLVGCTVSPVNTIPGLTIDTECQDPRPEICTREYRPVCALRDTGVRCVTTPCASTEWRTYGNACTACSDADVIGYGDGECLDADGAV